MVSLVVWFALLVTVADADRVRMGKDSGAKSLRFAKRGTNIEMPRVTYPITEKNAGKLKNTAAHSVRWLSHRQVQESFAGLKTWDQIKKAVWGGFKSDAFKPSHPNDDPDHFWRDFKEVCAAQKLRRKGTKTKQIMPVHPIFDPEMTMDEASQWVRADFPTDFPVQQVKRFLSQGLKLDPNIFARKDCHAGVEFVNGPVGLSGLAGWAITEVSPAAFASKWHEGRMRPEEAAIMISKGDLVPGLNLKSDIIGLKLKSATQFTAYGVGSPPHPAWPAMHSAASSTSTWLDIVADLTDQQREETRLLDFSIAYWRTFSGVHYPSDNRAGLALGQYIIKQKIAQHLADHYSCSESSRKAIKNYVNQKISKMKFVDWATWTPQKWNPPN